MKRGMESSIHNFKKSSLSLSKFFSVFFLLTLLLASCIETSSNKSSRRRGGGGGGVSNTASSVDPGYGRILQDNPIVLTGDESLGADVDYANLLQRSQDFIVNGQFLIKDCIEGVNSCFQVKENQTSTLLQSPTQKWAYDPNSNEFLQVNTFGHVQKIVDRFHTNMQNIYFLANPALAPSFIFPFQYPTSIPLTLFSSKAHWNGTQTLNAYAVCDLDDNAIFSPATFSICMGSLTSDSRVKFSQDPSVIYHEAGHALNMIMLNTRNVTSGLTTRADLGHLFYDEAGALGEGLADYFSYMMNERTHFGEWALGRFFDPGFSRPLTESDPLHVAGLDKVSDSRLRYPTYINYDPNNPTLSLEGIHYGGQILSHYLVAVTEDYESQCQMTKKQAIDSVVYLLTETFSYLGDLTSDGTDHTGDDVINLNQNHADEWLRVANPINYRKFAQTFARFQKQIYADINLLRCNGGIYPQDRIELLLDQYGLLLFDTYNEDGNSGTELVPGTFNGHNGTHTAIQLANRLQTVMISKEQLILNPNQGASQAFIFDKRSDMLGALESLQASGQITGLSNQLESDLPFNNGNAQISPGELVGLSLNLYNNSNTTMAGVQVLGTDWDHIKEGKPCNTFEDSFPLNSEGAAQLTTGEGALGGCDYITRSNGDDGDEVAPVCLVQSFEDDATNWVFQEDYRQKILLEKSQCLGGASNTQDCFVRVLKGADHAYFSRIEPQKTWGETQAPDGASPTFNLSNIIFLEVSKDIPPGTTFNCRFRTRFTNCSDCFHDSTYAGDDFLDFEYSGDKPFKIINFQFTVIN